MSGLYLPRTGSKAGFTADEQYAALNKAREKRQRKAKKRLKDNDVSALIIRPTIHLYPASALDRLRRR